MEALLHKTTKYGVGSPFTGKEKKWRRELFVYSGPQRQSQKNKERQCRVGYVGLKLL
ncbi:hypothetical protein [Idiomarina zobellii]|uniref:hypothetical protein n=1 Tax=Idiomarina zobellii TaxID=86103 RepID=UPI0015A3BABE|nr:hypothetical protein [Idiomarina zobellii]